MPNPQNPESELESFLPEFEDPGQTAGDPAPAADPAPEGDPAPEAALPTAGAPRLLNGEAKTPEQILAYAAELERKQIEAEAKLSVYEKTGQTPAAPLQEPQSTQLTQEEIEKKYASRMFSEPAAVLKEFGEEIERRIESKNAQSTEKQNFWKSFYDEFSDLAGLDDIVQLQLYKNQEQWKKVPVSQARKLLAHAAREYVGKIRDLGTPTETLPSGPAATAGATRGTAPRVAPVEEPVSFVDQVRKVNKKQAV